MAPLNYIRGGIAGTVNLKHVPIPVLLLVNKLAC